MARYNIVLAEYPHCAVFWDVVELLEAGLKTLGHEVSHSALPCASGSLDIILAPHLLRAKVGDERVQDMIRPGSIVYNFEPAESLLFEASLPILKRDDLVVWDYSRQGALKLHGLGIDARHVSLGYAPELARLEPVHEYESDVLFYGSMCPRREAVTDDCARRGLLVRSLFNVYGIERDRHIQRAKVVLNMHYYETAPTEDVRLTFLASNRKCVISEGLPDEPRKLGWAIWTDYDKLAEQCEWMVEAPRSARERVGELAWGAFSSGPWEADILQGALP